MTGWWGRLRRGGRRTQDPAVQPSTVEVSITPYPDGPLLIRGPFVLRSMDGSTIDPGRRTVALCRCGKSATKPFCDGTHKVTAFRTATEGN